MTSIILPLPRKSPKKNFLPAPNESSSNDSYLGEELETNNSNNLLPAMHSERNPDRTKLLKEEVDNLKEEINFLEAENNALKAENDTQMKNERLYNYENVSRNKDHFKKATGDPFSINLNLWILAKTAKI